MANVPERQQIVPEDFDKEDQDAAGRIAGPFNTYVEQLNEILNNNLTFSDNFRGAVKILTLSGDQSVTFRYDRREAPVGMWVVNYRNVDDSSDVVTDPVSVQWRYDGQGNIVITKVAGLDSAKNYSVTFFIVSG